MTRTRPTLFERLGRRSKVWGLVFFGAFVALVGLKAFARGFGGVFLPEPFGTLIAIGLAMVTILIGAVGCAVWLRDRIAVFAGQILAAINMARRPQDPYRQPNPRERFLRPVPPPDHPIWAANTSVYGHAALTNDPVPSLGEQIDLIDPPTGEISA